MRIKQKFMPLGLLFIGIVGVFTAVYIQTTVASGYFKSDKYAFSIRYPKTPSSAAYPRDETYPYGTEVFELYFPGRTVDSPFNKGASAFKVLFVSKTLEEWKQAQEDYAISEAHEDIRHEFQLRAERTQQSPLQEETVSGVRFFWQEELSQESGYGNVCASLTGLVPHRGGLIKINVRAQPCVTVPRLPSPESVEMARRHLFDIVSTFRTY